jgi:hypothetical protein
MKRMVLAAALAMMLGAPACSGGSGEPSLPRSASLVVPGDAASIIGDVTEVEGGAGRRVRILVEQIPTRSAGHPIAWIAITDRTRILARSGAETSRASLAEVAVGTRVWVWFDGPVAESFPVQAQAGTLLIER